MEAGQRVRDVVGSPQVISQTRSPVDRKASQDGMAIAKQVSRRLTTSV